MIRQLVCIAAIVFVLPSPLPAQETGFVLIAPQELAGLLAYVLSRFSLKTGIGIILRTDPEKPEPAPDLALTVEPERGRFVFPGGGCGRFTLSCPVRERTRGALAPMTCASSTGWSRRPGGARSRPSALTGGPRYIAGDPPEDPDEGPSLSAMLWPENSYR